jgi:uncharacterized protein
MTPLANILGAVYRKDRSVLDKLTPDELNQRDTDGRTPLMHAILAEDADISTVQLLIDRGADVNVHDAGEQWTALHFAARDQNAPVVLSLLKARATVDAVDVFGNTPLWRSVMNSTDDLGAIKALVEHGADPNRKNSRGISPADLARTTGRPDILGVFEGKQSKS